MPYSYLQEGAYGVSLFERLDADTKAGSQVLGPDPADVLESIKCNVGHLLNARLGESLSAPGLGLIDFNDATLGNHDLALQIKRAIKYCLDHYEPRIGDLDIRVLPDISTPLNLRFHIFASVDAGGLDKKIQIDLLLDSNRKYRVV